MKKEFLKDGTKVRNCDANIAKMNIFEYLRYLGPGFDIDFKVILNAIGVLVTFPFILIFYPVILIFDTMGRIKKAKRNVPSVPKGAFRGE